MGNHITVLRYLQPFGIEIDIDLSRELQPELAAELRELFYTQKLIVARNQSLSLEQQAQVMSIFGPVMRTYDSMGYLTTDETANTTANVVPTAELKFHADYEYTDWGALGLSLHAIDVVDGATSTRFADAIAACTDMPSDLLTVFDHAQIRMSSGFDAEIIKRFPDATPYAGYHPAISLHPETGQRYLRASEMQTEEIVGFPPEESAKWLSRLHEWMLRPENIVEHFWYKGDFLMWDNRATHHARSALRGIGRRHLQRVGIGLKPSTESDPTFHRLFA
ncbi:TauD/TfdA family dioxygenase [Sphingomonas oligophenolica]|uniref:TauD/TfdA family dioxygenase n=1 Tax=Sphingomonas oligophenolica TaxID=301154 RepID=A0ABU9YBI6_9SPHN